MNLQSQFNFGKFLYDELSDRKGFSYVDRVSRIYNESGVVRAGATVAGIGAAAAAPIIESPILGTIATVGAAVYGGKQIYEGIKSLF